MLYENAQNDKNTIKNIVHPNSQSVPHFLDRLKHINMLLSKILNVINKDCISATEIKKIFYHSMPNHQCLNFINFGQNIQDTDLDTLSTYMVQQESQTKYTQKKKARIINKKC